MTENPEPPALDATDLDEAAARYTRFADTFSAKVHEVPADAWDNQAPVPEWKARDVVGHLVEWIPSFFGERFGLGEPGGPSVADDPVGAWDAFDAWARAAFHDPAVAGRVEDTPMGPMPFAACFDMIATNDVFLHAWDLSRAAGLDETLDPEVVATMFAGMEPMDEMLRQSGQYGPRVPVPDDADTQTKLLAFIGRTP